MGAGVQQDADDPVGGAHENHAAAGDVASAEVARRQDLRLVADIDPGTLEDRRARGERLARYDGLRYCGGSA